MSKFPTKYRPVKNIVTCAGTKVTCIDKTTGEKLCVSGRRYTYKQDYDKFGKRCLVIDDTEDVYQKIQSFKDDTDIYKIVARYFNGDITALDKNKGFYADVSSLPKDFNEWHNKIVEGQNIFAGLPTDFKSMFGNDINQFMTSLYDKSFEEKFNSYVNSKNKSVSNVSNNVNNSVNVNNEKGVSNE